jgi:hypothetical protein
VHCKERWNQRKANMGSCVGGSGADSSATCTAKRCKKRRTNMASVPEDQVLTPLQHSTAKDAATRRTTTGSCVQRIRMLTPLQLCTAKEQQERRTRTGSCVRGSGVLTPLQHSALQRRIQSAQTNMGSCARGSGMLTPLHHSALQRNAGIKHKQQTCARGSEY